MHPVITVLIFLAIFAVLLVAEYFYSDPLWSVSTSAITYLQNKWPPNEVYKKGEAGAD